MRKRLKSKTKKGIVIFNSIVLIVFILIFNIIYIYPTLFNNIYFCPKSNDSVVFCNNLKTSVPSDLDFNFQSNELGNSSLSYNNLAHYNQLTENYSATMDFLNETSGSKPNAWNAKGGSLDTYQIVNIKYYHNHTFRILDDSVLSKVNIYHNLHVNYGTVEFYMLTNDKSKQSSIIIQDDGLTHAIFGFRIDSNQFWYNDGSWLAITSIVPYNNIWYHIRFDFEATTGNYLGLSQYSWNLYIDGLKFSDLSYKYSDNSNLSFICVTDDASTNYRFWIDSIGCSWKNYIIGSNIVSDINNISSNLLTNDKYEFNLDKYEQPLSYGYSNDGKDYNKDLRGWTIDDPSSANKVYIQNDYELKQYNITNENALVIEPYYFSTNLGGIYNDSLYIEGLNYTFSYELRMQDVTLGADNYQVLYM